MKIGPTKHGRAGDIEFAAYGNGETAIIVTRDGEREYVATVNLEGLGALEPGPGQIWVKTWSENVGVEEALMDAGIATPTHQRFACGPYDAIAVLMDLTPAALAECVRQRLGR